MERCDIHQKGVTVWYSDFMVFPKAHAIHVGPRGRWREGRRSKDPFPRVCMLVRVSFKAVQRGGALQKWSPPVSSDCNQLAVPGWLKRTELLHVCSHVLQSRFYHTWVSCEQFEYPKRSGTIPKRSGMASREHPESLVSSSCASGFQGPCSSGY